MDEHCPAEAQQISPDDWERTPSSVKQLVEEMAQRLGQLEKKLALLQAEQQLLTEKTNRTSSNSSQAPSSDPPSAPKRQRKRKSGKKLGGQPGHQGHSRPLYAVEDCVCVLDHYPELCRCCGGELQGEDASPYRHQIVEIPPVVPQVEEHRLHRLVCEQCGTTTCAELPEAVSPIGYGSRVVALCGSPQWSVPPQSEDGAKRLARFVWDIDVLGHRQQLEAESQRCCGFACRVGSLVRTATASGGSR